MKVTHLPVDPGVSGWQAILSDPPPAELLAQNITADWLVIGGGFAGLAATRRLRQLHPEARIVLLEARRFAEGPAGRNSGFMIDLPHDLVSHAYGGATKRDQATIRANRAAINFAAEMARDYGLSDEAFVRSGKVNAAAGAKGDRLNSEYAGHLEQMGEAHEILDAAQMREMTGTGYYCSGLYTPGTAMIQPAAFVRGVAAGLKSDRIRLFENSPVVGLERNQDWVAKTPAGKVTAPKVILAVNGHAQSFGHFRQRLLHVFTYASMTHALSAEECRLLGGVPRWGVTPADPMGTTVRRISGTGGDRIIIRNRFTCDPSMQVSARRIADVGRGHDKAFAARFPRLKGVEMAWRWGGRLCLSRNNVPAFGEVDTGLYSACCQNGLGTAKGTLHGMLAADLASGEKSDLLIEVLAQPEPVRLPPRPFVSLGANAVMRWGEFKAGREL
jgi:glycine/D-amino acid oxidase-like deaminating enzyme